MGTEFEKMLNQEWYDANNDQGLLDKRTLMQDLCFDYNHTRPADKEKRAELLTEILGELPENIEVISPFMADYGEHIRFGKNVFVNTNSYFMDGNYIIVGDFVFIGPNCGFYTNTHPEDITRRNEGLEKALPITIEDNVWIGANVSVMPGVTIGEGCIIGAGSVVTRDIPSHSVAVGSPCRVLRSTEDQVSEDAE